MPRWIKRLPYRAVSCLAIAASLVAQTHPSILEPPSLPASHADLADAMLEQIRVDRHVPAIQAAVIVQGKIEYSTAIGLADLQTRAPAETTTPFRIASISKSITGTALARLASRGAIDLEAPIVTYAPSLPQAWRTMTCRQLAGHTSGIRHYRPGEVLNNTRYNSLNDALAIFRDDPLEFPPGTSRAYSTYAFTLLGVVMEHADRKPFDQIIRDEVLVPLAMSHTTLNDAEAEHAARPYVIAPGGFTLPAPTTDHSYKVPGGGMLSTAEDLVRLAWAALTPGAFDKEVIRAIQRPISTADGRIHPYALGWSVLGNAETTAIGHTGSQPGSSCVIWADRRTSVAVAILCNTQQAAISFDDARALAALFASNPPSPP